MENIQGRSFALIGSIINDRYKINRVIGEGGMGTVYEAFDSVLNRHVAIKVLNFTAPGSRQREKLLEEAQVLARFKHPNIVTVHDAGEIDDGPYIVMELIEGPTLEERLPIDIDEVMKMIDPICDALEHAHKNGVIHRDLKPANILISSEGVPILTDFGIALSASKLSKNTISGTASYMSPELASGDAIDARSDLYSFGILLYQMTTGKLPFEARDIVAIIFQHLYERAVPPIELNPGITKTLNDLIVQMMEKSPENRPASAAVIREDLKKLNSLSSASGLLRIWREQGIEIIKPANLLIIQKSATEVTFEEADLEYLFTSALHSELDLNPWIDLIGSKNSTFRILVNTLKGASEIKLRMRIIDALSYLQTEDSADLLLDLMLEDPSPQVRSKAAVFAAKSGNLNEIANHLRLVWEQKKSKAALKTLAALVEKLGTPENFEDYPRVRVLYEAILKRWRTYKYIILKRALWAGIGAGVLQGINGSAAPLYTFIRDKQDYFDTVSGISLPAWVVSGMIGFIVIGFLQGYMSCFLVYVSDMFKRNSPEKRRYIACGLSGLTLGLLLIILTTMGQDSQKPPAGPAIYNTVYIIYGIMLGLVLTPAIPQLREPFDSSKQLPRILLSVGLAVIVTIPYVYLIYEDIAIANMPVRLVMGGLFPIGISLGLSRVS